jgi:hypothetical protein
MPVIAESGGPTLPEDSIWQPGQQAGSRPFAGHQGDQREHTENPVGPIGGYVTGGGGESGVTTPVDAAVPATAGVPAATTFAAEANGQTSDVPGTIPDTPQPVDGADAPVVYEGDVNGERVRIIHRGSNFEGEGVDQAPVIHQAPSPVIHRAPEPAVVESPAPSIPESTTYGSAHEAAVQEAIARARQQSQDQAESWRQERSGGYDAPVIERRVETWRSDAVIEERRDFPSQTVYEESPRFEPAPSPEPSYQQPSYQEPSWERPQEEVRDWRREESFESRGWGRDSDNGSHFEPRFEPQQEQRSEPAWEPERQEEIQIDDIRGEGHQ